jgi:hypothetical protein
MGKTMPAAFAAAFALCLWAFSASAAPATLSEAPGPAPSTYWIQYHYGRYPACPYRYHWECWSDRYGRGACGCRPDPGLYTGW